MKKIMKLKLQIKLTKNLFYRKVLVLDHKLHKVPVKDIKIFSHMIHPKFPIFINAYTRRHFMYIALNMSSCGYISFKFICFELR